MKGNRLYEVLDGLLTAIGVKDIGAIEAVAGQIKEIIKHAPLLPVSLQAIISDAYNRLGRGRVAIRPVGDLYVIVYATQSEGDIFTKQGSTIQEVIQGIKACWSTLFEARSIFHREINGLNHEDARISVVIQCV